MIVRNEKDKKNFFVSKYDLKSRIKTILLSMALNNWSCSLLS